MSSKANLREEELLFMRLISQQIKLRNIILKDLQLIKAFNKIICICFVNATFFLIAFSSRRHD